MKIRKCVIFLSCILLLLFPLVAMSPSIQSDSQASIVDISNISYIEHESITIMSDDDFITQGWPGSGTETDPYIIEGLSIISNLHCISIMNTNSWYVIRDCLLDSEDVPDPTQSNEYGDGINVEFGSNGMVENCVIRHKSTGVWVMNSENYILRDNHVLDCDMGLRLVSWDEPPIGGNSEISNNYIANCSYAIGVDGIADVLVADNIILSCWDGIVVGRAVNIVVENNTLTDIDASAININEATGCTVSGNDATVGIVGIYVDRSPNNQFIDNNLFGGGIIFDTWEMNEEHLHQDVYGNTVDGLSIGYFWDLTDSLIDGTSYGQIILANCCNVTLENGVYSNGAEGISVWYCQQITIRNVQVYDNFNGIRVKFGYDVTIEDSIIRDNLFGISFSDIEPCAIFRCDFQNNFIGALTEVYVYSLTVEDCTFLDNFGGLALKATPFAIVRNNIFQNCSLFIDYDSWYSSHWEHTIFGNTVNGKELGYFFGESNLALDGSKYGQIILASCYNVSITGGEISDVTVGIQIAYSTLCSIANIQFRNMPYGIVESNSDQSCITDCVFDHITRSCIYLDGNNHIVSGNEVYNYEWFIPPSMHISSFPHSTLLWGNPIIIESTWDSNFVEVYDNTIEKGFMGIMLNGFNHFVYNNTISNCDYGIDVYNGDVFDNNLFNIRTAISVSGENARCYGNTIQGGSVSILVMDGPNIEIFDNTIEDSSIGIFLQYVSDSYIHDNQLTNTTFRIGGWEPSHFRHRVENNYIDGKLLGYFYDISDTSLDCSFYGSLMLVFCRNVTVENGIFDSEILLRYCSFCNIVNVTVTNAFYAGVTISQSDNCKVIDSTFQNCARGIYVIQSPYTEIRGNTIVGSYYEGILSFYSMQSIIADNLIVDSGTFGLHMDYLSDDFSIVGNTLLNNFYHAIDISVDPYFPSGIIQLGEIIGNNVSDNFGTGINIGSGVMNITIYSNVIVSNALGNAQDNGMYNQWDNGVDTGNGWSDYSGTGYYFIPGDAGSIDRYPERIGGLVPPSISSPDDLIYEYGTTGNLIEWDVTADYSVTYEILLDTISLSSGVWNPDDGPISVSVDDLDVGIFEVYIYILGDGGEASDSVLVSIIDTTSPEWIETPVDQTIEVWQSFYYDVNAIDISGIASYWINDTINFEIDSDGNVIAPSLAAGDYGLEIRAYDPYGNYCSIEIQVTVLDSYAGLEEYFIGILLLLFPLLPYPAIVAMARKLVKLWLKTHT